MSIFSFFPPQPGTSFEKPWRVAERPPWQPFAVSLTEGQEQDSQDGAVHILTHAHTPL